MTRTSRGFTIIEMMATLAVAAILLTVAVPGFQSLVYNNRMSSNSNQFLGALNSARGAALDFGATSTICASNDGQTCCIADDEKLCDWTEGWIVYVDRNLNNALDSDEIISAMNGLRSSLQITSGSEIANVDYTSIGVLTPSNIRTFNLCDAQRSGETGRRIIINAAGRARVIDLNCG